MALIAATVVGFVVLTALVPMFWWAGAIIVLGALFVATVQFLQWQNTQFVVTNDRIITRIGVIGKAGTEIPLDRVMNISYKQSIKERLLNVGDLMIESAGENGQQFFSDVYDPANIQNIIYHEIELDAESDRHDPPRSGHNSEGPRRGGGGLGGRPGRRTGSGARPSGGPPRDQQGRPRRPGQGGDGSRGSQSSIPQQIAELDELRQRGILTDEEFSDKKRQLLDRL